MNEKRLSYLKFIYCLGVVVTLIYIYKYNYEYKVTDYNDVLIPLWLLLTILPPLVLKFSRHYLATVLSLVMPAFGILTYLIYTSGGADAPGVFWVASLPIFMGILLGINGAFIGYAVVAMVLATFAYFKIHHIGPNVIALYGNYTYEKIFNTVTFIIFIGLTTHHYIRGEDRLKKNLAEKNDDIENLLRILIHDVANTLSTMTYNLIKAKEDSETHSPTNELEKIEKALEDLNELLGQVRHLKSVKDGKATLPLKPISMSHLLNDLYEKGLLHAQEKGIKVRMHLPPDPLFVLGDRTILSTVVLQNVMSNAVKFSHPGSYIDVRTYRRDEHAVIEIEDYGIGIPQPILKHIFNVHAPTSRTGTQGEKGTGYGMPLVKEYLALMNGSITVHSQDQEDSTRGGGTLVVLSLPLTSN